MSVCPSPCIDLGQLGSIHVGDEVTTVCIDASGVIVEAPRSIAEVTEVDALRIRIRRAGRTGGTVIGSYHPGTGRALCHLYGPVAHLSVNPEHLAAARLAEEVARVERAKREESEMGLLAQALPIGEALAVEEAETVAAVLARSLSASQLATLADWLGVRR